MSILFPVPQFLETYSQIVFCKHFIGITEDIGKYQTFG